MSEEQEQLFYEMKQYLVQHSQKWNTLCDIEQLIIDKDKEIERLNNIINEIERYIENEYLAYRPEDIQHYYGKDILDKIKELKGECSNE